MMEDDFNNALGHGEHGGDADEAFASIARRLAVENARIEPPAALIDRIESRLKLTREPFRNRGWWMPALAAAAVVALAATAWIPFPGRGSDGEPRVGPGPSSPRVTVTLAPEAPFFTVPVETSSPDVSIVLLYRDIRPPRAESPQIHTPSTRRSET